MNTIKGVGKAIITWWPGCGVARGTYHLLGLSISVTSVVVLWNLKKLRWLIVDFCWYDISWICYWLAKLSHVFRKRNIFILLRNDTNMKYFLVKKNILNLVFNELGFKSLQNLIPKIWFLLFSEVNTKSNPIHMKKYSYPMKLLVEIYFQLSSLQLHN